MKLSNEYEINQKTILPERTVRPNQDELDEIGSETVIKGLKLILQCQNCGRKWSIWFLSEEFLLHNLPADWHLCLNCK